jgi:hypothetical protein
MSHLIVGPIKMDSGSCRLLKRYVGRTTRIQPHSSPNSISGNVVGLDLLRVLQRPLIKSRSNPGARTRLSGKHWRSQVLLNSIQMEDLSPSQETQVLTLIESLDQQSSLTAPLETPYLDAEPQQPSTRSPALGPPKRTNCGSKQHASLPAFGCFPVNEAAISTPLKGSTGPLNKKQREQAMTVRKLGACHTCRIHKRAVCTHLSLSGCIN